MTSSDIKCIPCEQATEADAFSLKKAKDYVAKVKGWSLLHRGRAIAREYTYKDFNEAMRFVGKVAEIAEAAGHHPDIFISYNHVRLELTTHSIGGLTENDFLVAAQINGIVQL